MSIEDKTQQLQGLLKENENLLETLTREGIGIDPDSIGWMRIEMFINEALGKVDESDRRLDFEIRVAKQTGKALRNTAKEARKQRALKRLHVPGRG